MVPSYLAAPCAGAALDAREYICDHHRLDEEGRATGPKEPGRRPRSMMTLLAPAPHERPDVAPWWHVRTRTWYTVLLVALVLPRLYSGSAMWLDEALSVNIASLPVPDLLEALRRDGSPPLYYLLLHAWTDLFGTSTIAVRAFSSLCSVLALPLAYVVGRRLGGPQTGAAAVLLLAACPFAIRYATEARMYALVMLLTFWWVLAVLQALERATPGRLGTVALVTGLLALTHYWALFLLVVGELLLVWQARRERVVAGGRVRWRAPAARIAVALPLGALLFLPWLPSFLFQTQHTGTPWADSPTWRDAVSTVRSWAGPDFLGLLLVLVLAALALAAWRRPAGRRLLVLGVGALLLGLLVSRLQGAGYATRYSAADVVPVLLAAAVGASRLPVPVAKAACAAAGVLALGVSVLTPLLGSRTQADDTAALLRAHLQPGDVVVYCPDQLGPSVDRLLPSGVSQLAYPTMGAPERVDWVDYAERNAAASPLSFAASVSASTSGAVWLVGNNTYRTFGTQCARLDSALTALRGSGTVLQQPAGPGEPQWVVAYPAAGAPANWFPAADEGTEEATEEPTEEATGR